MDDKRNRKRTLLIQLIAPIRIDRHNTSTPRSATRVRTRKFRVPGTIKGEIPHEAGVRVVFDGTDPAIFPERHIKSEAKPEGKRYKDRKAR